MKNLTKTSRIKPTIITGDYVWAMGKKPSGFGWWAFTISTPKGVVQNVMLSGNYSDCLKKLVKEYKAFVIRVLA
jgi:hypothetical protein